MEEKDQLDDFLEGTLPEAEREALRLKIEQSEVLKDQLAQKSLEKQVVDEMDREYWLTELKEIAEEEEEKPGSGKKGRIRQLYVISSIAASVLLLIWAVWPSAPNRPALVSIENWQQADYNIRDFPSGSTYSQNLSGTWETTIQEKGQTALHLRMECRESAAFLLTATLFKNNQEKEGDKITARGTYKVEANQIRLALETESIQATANADPFNAAAIEQWLKTRRLFRESLELVRLNAEEMIIRYNDSEGVIWEKTK